VKFHLGSFYETLGEQNAAFEYLQQARNTAQEFNDHRLLGLTQGLIIVSLTRQGRFAEAGELAEGVQKTLESLKDDEARARIFTNLALFYTESGDLSKGAQLTQEQIDINRHSGEQFGETIGSSNLGFILLQMGKFEESRLVFEQAISLATRIKARRMKAYGLLNLGLAMWRLGDPSEGQKIIQEQVCPELEATQDRFGIGMANLYLGLCNESMDDFRAASAAFGRAMEVLKEINILGPYMDAQAGEIRCYLQQRELEKACNKNDKLWVFLRKEGAGGLEFPILAYQTCAGVFETCNDPENAERARREGYEELMNRAERISDLKWRRSFLENIPEHRMITDQLA
jgi:tetratricopeptide (TPR) repeat protein